MFTDFIRGVFVKIVFEMFVILLLVQLNWTDIGEAMKEAPAGQSLINPFDAGEIQDFNPWFFFIGMFGLIYTKLSWQGNSSFNIAAKSAHEAKMADVLTNWRLVPQWGLFLMIVPIIAYTIFHHDNYKVIADNINVMLQGFAPADQSQLRVPMVLNYLLPVGLKGAFAAIMLAAAITCHNTYMHSWGSILIQDVVMPIRNKAFDPTEHLKYLKLSILGVGISIFILSILFQQTEKVFLFLNISGAIFVGGSGAAIIGGLYWKKGTTAAAWAAMITGALTAGLNILFKQYIPSYPINGQWGWFMAMVLASVVCFLVSLLTHRKSFDLDKLLHRGTFAAKEDNFGNNNEINKGWKVLAPTKEFTKGDKAIYWITTGWTAAWVVLFVIGTLFYFFVRPFTNDQWLSFWHVYTYLFLVASILVTIWFPFVGFKNIFQIIV